MKKSNKFNIENILICTSVFFMMLSSVIPASAGIDFNYNDGTLRNYTINDAILPSFVKLVDGDIEMPSITLKFSINKNIVSGSKSISINTGSFGPKTTSFPNQKVYIASGSTASVSYSVDASSSFAGTTVNVTTYRLVSNNVPFFSDISFALLNFNDLKNTWNNETKVLEELINTANDGNKVYEVTKTLDSAGDTGTISQSLAPGNYLILVTKGTNPKEIITSNIVRVMPFSSTTVVGDNSGFAAIGLDLNVNAILSSSAPSASYTYITSIINRSDYADKLGNINISWNSETLAQATRVNDKILNNANEITDIIPRSNIIRTTTSSKSANIVLKTGALTAGSYLVNTLVLNGTNLSVAFDQRLLTLGNKITTDITANINDTGYVNATLNIANPDANIIITIPNNTRATLSDGVTKIENITAYNPTKFNSTLEDAVSGSNLKFLGKNLTLLPAGAIFKPAIQIRFNYSDADIPSGVTEDSLKVYWYNGTTGAWESLTIYEHNKTGNYLIANLTHFSTFALLGTVTTTTPPSGGGGNGGGGGGGGGKSNENASNIEVIEKYDLQISKDALTSYRFTHAKNPIMFVNITGNTSLGIITASIEVLKNTSTIVKVSPEGLVYKNANIWVGTSGFATPKNIKEALITFRIDNEWMSANGVLASDIVLMKWDGTAWIKLETKVLSKDDTNSYFEGWTNSFSPFAIVAKTAAGPTVTTQPTPAGTPGITATVTPEPRNIEKRAKGLPGFGIGLAIAGLMAVVLRKRR
jgi:PGF-pre-PGF domain-containing protein/methanogen extracellular protein (TIGR04279 family)